MIRALVGLRHEGLTVLALVFAGSAMVEGGVATWGVLYLRAHDGLGVIAGVGAYVVGNSLATLTRIGSVSIVGKLGTRRTGARSGDRGRRRCLGGVVPHAVARGRGLRRRASGSRSCGRC